MCAAFTASAQRMMLQAPASANSNNTGDLFVVSAATATLTMVGSKGSLLLEGLRPHTIWFADKPARTGGQLATSDFFGAEFLQDGAHTPLVLSASQIQSPDYSHFSLTAGLAKQVPVLSSVALTTPHLCLHIVT